MGHSHPHDHDHHHESLLSGHDRPVHTDLKLSIENLSVSFGRKTVLSDVSADIAGGELVSVIGQNGCGKTTLLKAVAGRQNPLQQRRGVCPSAHRRPESPHGV